MKISVILLTFLCVFSVSECADILAFIPVPFYSHQATFRPLWRELAKRGHKITLLTSHLMEDNANITQIHFQKTREFFEEEIIPAFKEGFNVHHLLSIIFDMMDKFFETQLTEPGLVQLLKSGKKFDLFFVEMMLPLYPLLSMKFNCPFIGVNSMDSPLYVHGDLGNGLHPAVFSNPNFAFVNPFSFKERMASTGYTVLMSFLRSVLLRPFEIDMARKHLNLELDPSTNIIENASLLFINANPIFFPPRPLTPITINLEGGLHLMKPGSLPNDLKSFLDEAKDGCIYFSFGSTVTSDFLTPETVETFRKTFEELHPMRIMWKFDNTSAIKNTKNIMVRKWLPQQDILRHPNVKLFITQGGLHSMEEAVESAVPVLGMPFYGDQLNNVKMMVVKNAAVELSVKTMTKESLKISIQELLTNPIYKKNIERLSAISRDQPMNGLEKAVWWTEYVLRHGGTEHLRSPSADIPLYQYFFLDIIAFVLAVLLLLVFIFYYSVKLIIQLYRKIVSRKGKEKAN